MSEGDVGGGGYGSDERKRERERGEKLGELIELLSTASRRLSDDLACSNSSPGPHHGRRRVEGDGEDYSVRYRYRITVPKNYQQSDLLELVDVHARGGLEEDLETPNTLPLPPR